MLTFSDHSRDRDTLEASRHAQLRAHCPSPLNPALVTTPTAPRHLVTVWNPAYASDALEAHLRLLLEWDARATASQASDDDCYVWWGKVRSPQRQQPMPHLADVLALGAAAESQADDDPRETHLYLTDFRSLYVADVGLITTNDVATITKA